MTLISFFILFLHFNIQITTIQYFLTKTILMIL